MISVCVPVYNVDVRPLASQLAEEILDLEVPAEVLFMDDGSDETFRILNREIQAMKGISYGETERNRGRAAIRNRLGRSAGYPWLLFLDADSLLPKKGFLKRYLSSVKSSSVICGGTIYPGEPPADKTRRLRWKYGIHREQIPAEKRSCRSKFAITSNNFMISRELFLQTGFREEIRDYGHEDTLLGYDLFQKGIPIDHIDNPVVHTGLETSGEYLRKTESALRNLLLISRSIINDPAFSRSSGLLRKLNKLDTWNLTGLAAVCFRISKPLLVRNLTGAHPRLLIFDLYRLGYLCFCRNNSDV